ncbi:MAG: hypothetical protein H0W25_06785, partial [Acidimicrobiia bacterium]|nr:hypothetical protein [Acidimicrobiia bacterium]
TAPDAVADDATAVADAFATARGFLERIDYDEARLSEVTAAERDAFDVLQGVTSAASALGRFAAANCSALPAPSTAAP